jgi:hypothetical protein
MIHLMHGEPTFADIFLEFLPARGMQTQADLVDQLFNSSAMRQARIALSMAEFGTPGQPQYALLQSPVLNQEKLTQDTDRLVVLLESSVISPECLGFHWNGGRILQDRFAEIECLSLPPKKATLVEMLTME